METRRLTGATPATAPSTGPFEEPLPLPPARRRWHLLGLALILALGFAHGAYMAVTTQVWSPIDEVGHYGYVESLARGDGIPTVGIDLVSDEAIRSMKLSPTSIYLYEPYQADNDDPNWGATRFQYEAVHGPTYYALMAPFYWLGRPAGIMGSLLAIRLGTVLVALAAVPLTWALARRLFPERPSVWLLSPLFLVAWNSMAFGAVSNDALVVPLAVLAGLLLFRALARPDLPWRAVWAGGAIGLALLTKTTTLVLVPLLGLVVVAWLIRRRPPWSQVLALGWRFVAAGAAVLAPWLLWNLWSYHSISASAEVDKLTGSLLPPGTLSFDTLNAHLTGSRRQLWEMALLPAGQYAAYWERVVVVVVVLGCLTAVVRRRFADAWVIAWTGASLGLAFLSMEAIVFGAFGGTGGPVGRHLFAAMPYTAIALGASVVTVLGARWAPAGVAVLLLLGVRYERDILMAYVGVVYEGVAFTDDEAPEVSQLWSDGVSGPVTVLVDPPCPATAVAIRFQDQSGQPENLEVTVDGEVQLAPLVAPDVTTLDVYRLPQPIDGPFSVTVDQPITIALSDREPRTSIAEVGGADPVVRVYCRVDAARTVAFDQSYGVQHPGVISAGMLDGASAAAVVMAWGAVAAGVAYGIAGARGRRHDDEAGVETTASGARSAAGEGDAT